MGIKNKQTRAEYLAERKRVDDFIAQKLAKRRASMTKTQPAVNPYMQGMQNLLDILLQRSPIQK